MYVKFSAGWVTPSCPFIRSENVSSVCCLLQNAMDVDISCNYYISQVTCQPLPPFLPKTIAVGFPTLGTVFAPKILVNNCNDDISHVTSQLNPFTLSRRHTYAALYIRMSYGLSRITP